MNVGRTSPGIVFERIIKGLSKIHEVDVVSANYDPSVDLSLVKNTIITKRYFRHPRIYKALISLFRIDPRDILWAKKVRKALIAKNLNNYELILSLVSFHHYAPLITANTIKNLTGIKHAVYMVDAIPAPLGWSKNNAYYKGVKNMMARLLPNVDYLFSSNSKMLKYQIETFVPNKKLVSKVLHNPAYGHFKNVPQKTPFKYMFLYTGGIYGLRTPKHVISAFKIFLEEFPNSTLEFVGSEISKEYLSEFTAEERKKVLVHPFTKDLKDFYERATALIDIDAVLTDDVYLSGKVVNYLLINRIIISISGKNSPARELFKEIPSIIKCDHLIEDIFNGMKTAVLKQREEIDFSDRRAVINLFKLDSVIDQFNKTVQV